MPQGFIPLCSKENSCNTQNHHFPVSIFFFKKINLELGSTADFCGEQPLLTFFSFGVLLLFIYCSRFPWGTKSHLRISQCYHNVNDLMYRSSRWNIYLVQKVKCDRRCTDNGRWVISGENGVGSGLGAI